MKKVIVPTDFSAISLNAANYAADLACVIGADLALVHTIQLPLTFSEVPAPVFPLSELQADAEARIKELKEKLMSRTGERIKILTAVIQGDVVTEIGNYCETVNPFAVVMGTESAGAFERLLFGGKAISAVRQLPWPLILVPPDVRFSSIRKIGLACDFREVAETIPIKEIKSLVESFHAELHVLYSSGEKGKSYSNKIIEESGWLQDILGGLNPRYHFIESKEIEKAIIDFAEKNNIDLLIIIPKKHSMVSKIFHHSHSKRMVLHTHVPVMAIHE